MTDDTWDAQDLPVLRAAVEALDDPDAFEVYAQQIAEDLTGLTEKQVRSSLHRLTVGGYLQEPPTRARSMAWGRGDSVVAYSEKALRAVGTWPSPEVALERLVAALEAAAADTDDVEAQGALRKTARWLGSTATNVGAGVATAVITGGM